MTEATMTEEEWDEINERLRADNGDSWRALAEGAQEELISLADRVSQAEAEVERLREARRWIPIGERMPAPKQEVSLRLGQVVVGPKIVQGYWDGMFWYMRGYGTSLPIEPFSIITHWLPLPEPPKEGDDDCGNDR